MRKFLALAVLIGLSGVLVTGAILAQRGESKIHQKGPPTFFDKSVENAFFKDVLRQHGPGKISSLGIARPKTGVGGKTPTPPTAGGDSEWGKIVSAETLTSEINSSINKVQSFVGNKSQWNKGHRKVRTLYNTMAICFGVISQYGGDVKFKKQAPTLRDALAQSAASAKVNSDGALKQASTRFDELKELRNGSSIPLNEEAEAVLPFGQYAALSEIMKRMQAAHEQEGNSLKAWTSSAADFKAKKGEILHEAEILGMLARVMQDESFELAAENGYVEIAKNVQTSAKNIVEAVKLDSLDAVQAAVGKISNACTQCHGEYRD